MTLCLAFEPIAQVGSATAELRPPALLITPIASAAAGWLIMWPIRRRFDHFVKQMNAGLDRIDQSLNRINQSIDRIEEADK